MNKNKDKRVNKWEKIDWRQVIKTVESIQEKIVEAKVLGELKIVYQLQRQLVTTWSSSALTGRKVSTSSGSKTPGIDKEL